jgi:hypothetical protein
MVSGPAALRARHAEERMVAHAFPINSIGPGRAGLSTMFRRTRRPPQYRRRNPAGEKQIKSRPANAEYRISGVLWIALISGAGGTAGRAAEE